MDGTRFPFLHPSFVNHPPSLPFLFSCYYFFLFLLLLMTLFYWNTLHPFSPPARFTFYIFDIKPFPPHPSSFISLSLPYLSFSPPTSSFSSFFLRLFFIGLHYNRFPLPARFTFCIVDIKFFTPPPPSYFISPSSSLPLFFLPFLFFQLQPAFTSSFLFYQFLSFLINLFLLLLFTFPIFFYLPLPHLLLWLIIFHWTTPVFLLTLIPSIFSIDR